jgi:hypothetical protein
MAGEAKLWRTVTVPLTPRAVGRCAATGREVERGSRILELGAGTGAVGLAAMALGLGKSLTLTDVQSLQFLLREVGPFVSDLTIPSLGTLPATGPLPHHHWSWPWERAPRPYPH